MKVINKETIKALNPCKDRYENYLVHYSEFIGTIEDFLLLPKISHDDKLWVSLRLLSRKNVEAFALDCAVSAQKYAANAAYAADAAYYAAYAADAADAAAADAAYYAADAAYYAAYAAYAADAAAADAAYYAAAAAAYYAANAAYAADAAAYYAANAAEKEFQIEALIWLFNSEVINEEQN
jgi:hypothetical protein